MIDYSIDTISFQTIDDKLKVSIKGWAFCDDYRIDVYGDNSLVYCFKGNQQRFDVAYAHHVKIENNQYGFEEEIVIPGHVELVKLFLVYGTKKQRIYTKSLTKKHNIYAEVCSFCDYAQNILYKNLISGDVLGMIRRIPQKLKSILDGNNQSGDTVYDPDNINEYHSWLENHKYKQEKEIDKITYFCLCNNQSVHGDNIICNEILNLDEVHTDYICFVGKECTLYEPFFSYVSECVNYDLLYFDHDHRDEYGERYRPELKPDFSYDTLMGVNYIGNVFIVRKSFIQRFDKCKIDLYEILKYVVNRSSNIGHISEILFSDNNHEEIQKNKRSVENSPLVSIVIPTKDHIQDLKICLDSIHNKSTYKNYEIVVIDNNSEKKESLEYFDEVNQTLKNVSVYRMECEFNYSYINNYAIDHYCNGEYLILLNNDTEVLTPDWIEQFLAFATDEGVGSVGALMFFPDQTIQHAGVIMGLGGVAGHAHYGKPADYQGYGYELKVPYNVSCNTAACLMFSRKHYEEVGKLNENLKVAFNDVDFGLKLLSRGYRNVMLPTVNLIHYESKSRGTDNSAEKMERYLNECEYMKEHWANYISQDPYYNKNYSLIEEYKLRG